jgi:hypothetical protein
VGSFDQAVTAVAQDVSELGHGIEQSPRRCLEHLVASSLSSWSMLRSASAGVVSE